MQESHSIAHLSWEGLEHAGWRESKKPDSNGPDSMIELDNFIGTLTCNALRIEIKVCQDPLKRVKDGTGIGQQKYWICM